jgi:hypothetical protein
MIKSKLRNTHNPFANSDMSALNVTKKTYPKHFYQKPIFNAIFAVVLGLTIIGWFSLFLLIRETKVSPMHSFIARIYRHGSVISELTKRISRWRIANKS